MSIDTRTWVAALLFSFIMWIVGRIGQIFTNGGRSPRWLCKLCLVFDKSQKLDSLFTLIQLQAYEFIPLLWLTRNLIDPQWRNAFMGFGFLALAFANNFLLGKLISKRDD